MCVCAASANSSSRLTPIDPCDTPFPAPDILSPPPPHTRCALKETERVRRTRINDAVTGMMELLHMSPRDDRATVLESALAALKEWKQLKANGPSPTTACPSPPAAPLSQTTFTTGLPTVADPLACPDGAEAVAASLADSSECSDLLVELGMDAFEDLSAALEATTQASLASLAFAPAAAPDPATLSAQQHASGTILDPPPACRPEPCCLGWAAPPTGAEHQLGGPSLAKRNAHSGRPVQFSVQLPSDDGLASAPFRISTSFLGDHGITSDIGRVLVVGARTVDCNDAAVRIAGAQNRDEMLQTHECTRWIVRADQVRLGPQPPPPLARSPLAAPLTCRPPHVRCWMLLISISSSSAPPSTCSPSNG